MQYFTLCFGFGFQAPVVKINMGALLNVTEDPELTALWIQALDSARSVRVNKGEQLKNIVKNALAITTNDYVKTYLKKSMRLFKVNSAGTTKRAIVWLVDKVSLHTHFPPYHLFFSLLHNRCLKF